jgi:hypothetical protein
VTEPVLMIEMAASRHDGTFLESVSQSARPVSSREARSADGPTESSSVSRALACRTVRGRS